MTARTWLTIDILVAVVYALIGVSYLAIGGWGTLWGSIWLAGMAMWLMAARIQVKRIRIQQGRGRR